MSAIWGSPLVADGRVYIGTQDGDVLVFELARERKLLAKNPMGHGVHGTPVAAGWRALCGHGDAPVRNRWRQKDGK